MEGGTEALKKGEGRSRGGEMSSLYTLILDGGYCVQMAERAADGGTARSGEMRGFILCSNNELIFSHVDQNTQTHISL